MSTIQESQSEGRLRHELVENMLNCNKKKSYKTETMKFDEKLKSDISTIIQGTRRRFAEQEWRKNNTIGSSVAARYSCVKLIFLASGLNFGRT